MPQPNDTAVWLDHWRDETDAAFLYRELAAAEPDAKRQDLYRRLADVEDRHAAVWKKILDDAGQPTGTAAPSRRARFMVWLARRFGPKLLTGMLLREEGQEVQGYLALHKGSRPGPVQDAALELARDSAHHAQTLSTIAGKSGEPWHRAESGGVLRNVVYGFNDGLTANFGLVAGVIGASVAPHVIMVSGVAGMIADALSMGSSGYLAAKSEQEVYANEIAMEREEIRMMPEIEAEEMALLYEAKGIEPAEARKRAQALLADPELALAESVREELGIHDARSTPFSEGLVTGSATAVGAFIPVAPFLFMEGRPAIILSFVLAMGSHFLVGAARSVFTGRSVWRSGFDMFIVGLGVAAVGYFVGDIIARML